MREQRLQDAIDHGSIVVTRPAATSVFFEPVCDQIPLVTIELVAIGYYPNGFINRNSNGFGRVLKAEWFHWISNRVYPILGMYTAARRCVRVGFVRSFARRSFYSPLVEHNGVG